MRAVVVYDSFYGNTETIARAVGEAVGRPGEVGILKAGEAGSKDLKEAALLVVGSPTRKFRPTPAVMGFLKGLSAGGLKGVRVAAFDTRISVEETRSRLLKGLVKIFGYAAGPIARELTRKGGTLILPAEGFIVKGTEGPLKDGERERAADWARRIAEAP